MEQTRAMRRVEPLFYALGGLVSFYFLLTGWAFDQGITPALPLLVLGVSFAATALCKTIAGGARLNQRDRRIVAISGVVISAAIIITVPAVLIFQAFAEQLP